VSDLKCLADLQSGPVDDRATATQETQ
ncbi:uncharacterized protein METZ01_LOCUS36126, partial [marine metagenome]